MRQAAGRAFSRCRERAEIRTRSRHRDGRKRARGNLLPVKSKRTHIACDRCGYDWTRWHGSALRNPVPAIFRPG